MAGDVVRIAAGYPSSAQKSHIVDALVSPMRTGTQRVQPEGVEGWLRRRQEKRRKKLLRLPGVEEADNPAPVPQSEAEEKLLQDDNSVPAPQNETKKAENPVLVPQSEATEEEEEEEEEEKEMPAARRRAGNKAWGIFGEVLLGKRVGVRVCEDGRKLVNGSLAGPAAVPAGQWKFLWKGLEERKRLKAASRAASKAQAEKGGQEFDEQQWEEKWRDRKRKGPAAKKKKNKQLASRSK